MAARLGGDALVLLDGAKPYVVDAPGHVELEVARCRTAVSVPLLDQLRPEALKTLSQLMQDDRPTAGGCVIVSQDRAS